MTVSKCYIVIRGLTPFGSTCYLNYEAASIGARFPRFDKTSGTWSGGGIRAIPAPDRNPGDVQVKWLYTGFGFVGALVPVIWIYVSRLPYALPGIPVDLGLLFFAFGIGLLFAPVGVAGGLVVAAIIHFSWSLNSRRSRNSI